MLGIVGNAGGRADSRRAGDTFAVRSSDTAANINTGAFANRAGAFANRASRNAYA